LYTFFSDTKRPDEEVEDEEEEEEVTEYVPSPYPDNQCSRTFPIHPKYRYSSFVYSLL
jgi:hypothetical protein